VKPAGFANGRFSNSAVDFVLTTSYGRIPATSKSAAQSTPVRQAGWDVVEMVVLDPFPRVPVVFKCASQLRQRSVSVRCDHVRIRPVVSSRDHIEFRDTARLGLSEERTERHQACGSRTSEQSG
jgi:hypothetical protein